MERQSNTLGTVGTILGSIGTAGALGGAAKGLLGIGGGGYGGGCCGNNVAAENAELRAKVAALESEKYTDGKFEALSQRTLQEQKAFFDYVLQIKGDVDTLRGDFRVLQTEVDCLVGKVDDNAKAANQAICGINARINAITKVVIPSSVVCEESTTTT